MLEQQAWNFNLVLPGNRACKKCVGPQVLSHSGDGIGKSELWFVIPSSGPESELALGVKIAGQQGEE